MNNTENKNPSNLPEKVENFLKKTEETVNKGNETLSNLNSTTNNIGQTIDKSSNLIESVNNLGSTFLETRKINSNTVIELARIHSNHVTLNNKINLAYGKQNRAMTKAENAVDYGLENGDIEFVKIGLENLTKVANHNPMTEEINKMNNNFEDDDFIIEI